jgi:hypothetical protein
MPPRSPLLFSPSLTSTHGQASRLLSTPVTEPPRPSSVHFRPPPSPFPPLHTVRSTHPLPFSDLEPPSPLSSSPAAPGASWRCRCSAPPRLRHHIGEPHLRSPCSAHPPLGCGARAQDLAAGKRATACGVRAGRLSGWTGPPGHGPAGLLADHAWQAAGPRAVTAGQFWPNTVRQIFKSFLIILNSRNCFKLTKFVETCRSVQKCKLNFVWILLNHYAQWLD